MNDEGMVRRGDTGMSAGAIPQTTADREFANYIEQIRDQLTHMENISGGMLTRICLGNQDKSDRDPPIAAPPANYVEQLNDIVTRNAGIIERFNQIINYI